ncbi:hypothetical protein DSO57_1006756 [Entomophthora muscae]|uniref:Uncharacterized protein n=1 Tax=Entomophthora muscae TaxID=34485 RepID=A0ACC2RME9_9FUNG|nr:hypothetical protein DSO57_1006756 [Entomophthora muscae]
MILPVLRLVVFFLVHFLLFLWTTSPNLWSCISSSACLARDKPSSLLHLSGGASVYPSQSVGEQLGTSSSTCEVASFPHLYALVTHQVRADGVECILSSAVSCVLSLVPSPSGHPSTPLGSILVVHLTGMGAKLSLAPLSYIDTLWELLGEKADFLEEEAGALNEPPLDVSNNMD